MFTMSFVLFNKLGIHEHYDPMFHSTNEAFTVSFLPCRFIQEMRHSLYHSDPIVLFNNWGIHCIIFTLFIFYSTDEAFTVSIWPCRFIPQIRHSLYQSDYRSIQQMTHSLYHSYPIDLFKKWGIHCIIFTLSLYSNVTMRHSLYHSYPNVLSTKWGIHCIILTLSLYSNGTNEGFTVSFLPYRFIQTWQWGIHCIILTLSFYSTNEAFTVSFVP